jgi:hypothetical protein
MLEREKARGKKKKNERGYVPMPMTVPYSDFLSSAETAGGQRQTTARKMKKARDSPEMRRAECVLVGRDMLEKGRERVLG